MVVLGLKDSLTLYDEDAGIVVGIHPVIVLIKDDGVNLFLRLFHSVCAYAEDDCVHSVIGVDLVLFIKRVHPVQLSRSYVLFA